MLFPDEEYHFQNQMSSRRFFVLTKVHVRSTKVPLQEAMLRGAKGHLALAKQLA
jgi:hypothetical protein